MKMRTFIGPQRESRDSPGLPGRGISVQGRLSMLRSSNSSRPALVESLEGRRLFAGNVTAVFNGDVVTIAGDNKANNIEVKGTFHGYIITGSDATTVNGSAAPAEVVTGSAFPIVISMGNGDDKVALVAPEFGDTTGAAGLGVDTGNGNDSLSIDHWSIFGRTGIDTGNGNDSVSFGADVEVSGNLAV